MANETKTLIDSKTVGAGGSASIAFTAIAQTYTDLEVVLSLRSTSSLNLGNVGVNMSINGVETDRLRKRIYGANGSQGSDSVTTSAVGATLPTSTSVSNTFGVMNLYFANYSGSGYKAWSMDNGAPNTGNYELDIVASLWSSTAAITSLTFTMGDSTNFAQYSTAYLYGIKKGGTGTVTPIAPKATGGTIVYSGGYFYHTFTSSGTFTPTASFTADLVVTAGGGGGGSSDSSNGSGGGGAGGVLVTSASVTSGTPVTVTIGAGGTGGSGSTNSTNGVNSSFGASTAIGGGRGGNGYAGTNGGNGGSGGGAPNYYTAGTGTAGQGYNGANAAGQEGGGGGGGGAAASGNAGGAGKDVSAYTNGITYLGGGGGGGVGDYNPGGSGGVGGGGTGGSLSNGNGTGGTANTGGGAGGCKRGNWAAQAGGSGIVVVRYAA